MPEAMFRKKAATFFYEHPLTVLIIFFCISVAVRLPNLDRPLSKHHEVNAALVLINAEEWNRKTPAFYHYVPVHSYHFSGDNVSDDIIGEHGYLVNISFGTLWYIMPYLFFQLLHAPPSPLLLQVFNLLLHFATIIIVYKLALELFNKYSNASSRALATAVIYLFSPGPLWFHGNGYVHEVAVLPFVLAVCLLYTRIWKNKKLTLFQCVAFFLLIVAGICCDWIMCFVAAAVFVTSFRFWIKTRGRQLVTCMVVATAAVIVGVSLTAMQFSAFMGFHDYSQGLLSRFITRGITGDAQPAGLLHSAGLASYYLLGYGLSVPLLLYGSFFIPLFRKSLVQRHLLTGFLIISAAVCLLHHIVFWGFSNIHDYSVLKSGIIISLLSSIALFTLPSKWRVVALAAILFFNTGVYYFVNRPGSYAVNGQPYTYFQSLGQQIKAIAGPNDYIFIDTPEMSLLLTYYSKRYYRNVKDAREANTFFKELQGKKALFIHTDNFRFVNAVRLTKE